MRAMHAILLSIFLVLTAVGAQAANNNTALTLFDQPANNAKTVATIAKGQAIIPIFMQGDWVKIADPSNGNVGWVNNNILSAQGYPKINIKIFATNTGNQSFSGYQIEQSSGTGNNNDLSTEPHMSAEQINSLANNMLQQQKILEQQMLQMQENWQNFDSTMQTMLAPVSQPTIKNARAAQEKSLS